MIANLTFFGVLLALIGLVMSTERVSSFSELAQSHCDNFDVEMLWRIASGRLSEKYGEQFFDFDCYVRQFVREGKHPVTQTASSSRKSRMSPKRNNKKTSPTKKQKKNQCQK